MKILLSLLAVVAYWCLNAYEATISLNISFLKAILLDYDNNHIFIKLTIVAAIIIITMIPTKTKEVTKKIGADDFNPHVSTTLNSVYTISETILSQLPLEKQLNDVIDIVESQLSIKTAFIASFKDDKIIILNTNKSLKKIGIKAEYIPSAKDLVDKSIDKLLSIHYTEKQAYIDSTASIGSSNYRIVIQPYKDSMLKNQIGIMAIVLNVNDKREYQKFLEKVCEQLSFTISFSNKKKELLSAQKRHHDQFTSIDTELNIASNFKIQDTIEYEIRMAQRYGSSLSLMIIGIDEMRSITNVFREEESIEIKKEFALLVKKEIRETDVFGRWSNDNFGIVVPHLDHRASKSFAKRLGKIISEHKFKKVGNITCSFGITSFNKKDTIGQFRRRAENALQAAISRGGNTIEIKILA